MYVGWNERDGIGSREQLNTPYGLSDGELNGSQMVRTSGAGPQKVGYRRSHILLRRRQVYRENDGMDVRAMEATAELMGYKT